MRDRSPARLDLLASPVLLFSVALLLANDWVLKPAFHNGLTGKLSDMSGLAAVTVFSYAIRPKGRWWTAGLISLSFVYWKSPYSQAVIDALNVFSPFHVGRTVDYSDLLALPVVWIVSSFAPRMRGLPVHHCLQYALAVVSLVAFTATSYINTRMVRETADLAVSQQPEALQNAEEGLQHLLDSLAARYKLTCVPCEPLSSGRLYGGRPPLESDLSLLARLDLKSGTLLYDIRSSALNREPSRRSDVDSLREELTQQLRARFPVSRVQSTSLPRKEGIRVVVYKQKSLTSYRDQENQRDSERTMALVEEAAVKHGMKKERSLHLHYFGALLGPKHPYDRELTVSITLGESPLVSVDIYRASDHYVNLQQAVADDIVERLRVEFGRDRAGFR